MLKKEYIRAVRFFETNPTKKNGASWEALFLAISP
jgi:hypothetical protein